MESENESIESIVAEMRHPKPGTLADVCPWWADGGDCVKCPLGGGGKMCIFDKFADRIEAARKRELLSKNAEYDNSGSVVVSGGKQNNAAAMREALSDACYAMFNFLKTQNGGYEEMANALDKAKAALSAPARNCDMPHENDHELWLRWQNYCAEIWPSSISFSSWLLAPAAQEGGAAQ